MFCFIDSLVQKMNSQILAIMLQMLPSFNPNFPVNSKIIATSFEEDNVCKEDCNAHEDEKM